jgi:hypothetical protein
VRGRQYAALALGLAAALCGIGVALLHGEPEPAPATLGPERAAPTSLARAASASASGETADPGANAETASIAVEQDLASAAAPAAPARFESRDGSPAAVDPRSPARRSPAAPALARIALDEISAEPGTVSTTISGHDAGAPRALELWRVERERVRRVARGYSDLDGNLHAPQLALAGRALELVVTPIGVRPGEPAASEPARLPAYIPSLEEER